MSKIVIIAPAEAKDDVAVAVKVLKAAGHDVDIEEPIPKNLLHIVLGLLGPSAYGFGPGYAFGPIPREPEEPAEEPSDDEPANEFEIPAPAEEFAPGDDDFKFEELKAVVDGVEIPAVLTTEEVSELVVSQLEVGPKTKYCLNESTFAFWPVTVDEPTQKVMVTGPLATAQITVKLVEGAEAQLKIGTDAKRLFRAE